MQLLVLTTTGQPTEVVVEPCGSVECKKELLSNEEVSIDLVINSKDRQEITVLPL